jgi:chromosome segregation ATPase
MIYDGHGQSDPEFAKDVADSLGAFAIVNLWSVDNLRKQLNQKNLLIEQLHNDMKQMEVTVRERINSDISQVRQGFEQQIKKLEEKLKLGFQNQHVNNNMVSQRDTLINQLQVCITTIKSTIIDISAFKKQASEINERLQIVQQNLYESLDTIQKHYQVINNSLQIIDDKEKQSSIARSKFQEFIVWRQNLNVLGLAPFSEFEQIKGEIALNT